MKTIAIGGAMFVIGLGALIGAQTAASKPRVYWPQAELATLTSELIPASKKTDIKIAAKPLLRVPTHSITLASRPSGPPELHDLEIDIIVIREGGGMFQVGGELVDPKETSPGQWTASSVKGGEMFNAVPGDVFYIPKKTPHMWHLSGDQQVTYLAMKVIEK